MSHKPESKSRSNKIQKDKRPRSGPRPKRNESSGDSEGENDYDPKDAPKSSYQLLMEKYKISDGSKAALERKLERDPKMREYLEDEGDNPHKRPEPVTYEKQVNNVRYTVYQDERGTKHVAQNNTAAPVMIEVMVNDRMGKKERVKCFPDDTVGDLKKLISAKTGTRADKIRLQKGYHILSDAIMLSDYEIKHGFGLEMYYN